MRSNVPELIVTTAESIARRKCPCDAARHSHVIPPSTVIVAFFCASNAPQFPFWIATTFAPRRCDVTVRSMHTPIETSHAVPSNVMA